MGFKRAMIREDKKISIVQQCKMLSLSRSGHYYKAVPEYTNRELEIMLEMDKIFMERPFFGHRSMHDELLLKGYKIGRDRVLKYMKVMGLEPIYPKPKTTIKAKGHKIYPYLLDNLEIEYPNQVWAADITYIPVRQGFCYLVAIIDWYSRKILSWRISNSMGASFCIEALQEALENHGKPEIFNTDQGSQFTSNQFTSILLEKKIEISMDSKGRALDNIIIERFWRTIKYENIYIYNYDTIFKVKQGVNKYIQFYNYERRHTALGKQTPSWIFKQSFRAAA